MTNTPSYKTGQRVLVTFEGGKKTRIGVVTKAVPGSSYGVQVWVSGNKTPRWYRFERVSADNGVVI